MPKLESIRRRRRAQFAGYLVIGGYLVMGALTTLGCGSGYALGAKNAKPLVLNDASKDLDCPIADLRAEEGWGGRWHAVGCGRKADYNAKCDGISCQVVPDGAAVPWEDRPTNDPMWQH